MRKSILLLVAGLIYHLISYSQNDFPAYRIFTGEGKSSGYDKMIKELKNSQVIFFGELHNNPIAHWLQLELTKSVFTNRKELVLAAEMFEADDQLIMDEYLIGKLSKKTFKDEAKLWPNYSTDYEPLVEFAKENRLAFVCANIPRRYANMVYKSGLEMLDSLHEDAKRFIAPLPIPYDAEVGCYKSIAEAAGGHGGENLPKSQAIKDATMAWFISRNLTKNNTIIHYNGSYHSDNKEGILWYLDKYRPGTTTFTITTVEQASLDKLEEEYRNKADFIIVVPETMTKTH